MLAIPEIRLKVKKVLTEHEKKDSGPSQKACT